MEITWYGHACFRITERGMATVVTDPFDHKTVGHKQLALKADIITISKDEPGHNFADSVKGSQWQINGPGEYEIGGVFMTVVPTGKNGSRNLVSVLDYGGVTVAHLGTIKSVPSRKEVEAFGNVDVLLAPVGGGSSLNAAKAAEVVSLIEPGLVVPMHYNTDDSKVKLTGLNPFLKQMGLGKATEEESLKVNKSSIPEETKVVVLAAKQ